MDRTVISEDIVELSAYVENLTVQCRQTAELNNTENGKFKIYCIYQSTSTDELTNERTGGRIRKGRTNKRTDWRTKITNVREDGRTEWLMHRVDEHMKVRTNGRMDGQTNGQTNRRRVQTKGDTACAMLLPWRLCDNNNNNNNNNNDNFYSAVK